MFTLGTSVFSLLVGSKVSKCNIKTKYRIIDIIEKHEFKIKILLTNPDVISDGRPGHTWYSCTI
jgi:hypothetical protein